MSIIRNSKLRPALAACALATALAAFLQPAWAVETFNLTAVDGYPPRALQVKTFINYFIPQVDKRLATSGQYKINWNKAFAGQIVKVKHVITGMQKGLSLPACKRASAISAW